MAAIRRIVLDTLKPHGPSIVDLARSLGDLPGIEAVNISIYEMDRKVENAKITEGADIDYEQVRAIVVDNGGAIHFVGHISKRSLLVSGIKTVSAAAACIGLSYLFD